MGSSISDILAILFMDKLENIALSSHLMISPYKIYVFHSQFISIAFIHSSHLLHTSPYISLRIHSASGIFSHP